jgi:hypothetical protein
MSDRQTQKLTTPSGREFEIKTYLTARERNELRNVFLQNVAVDPSTGMQKGDIFASDLLDKGNRKTLELALISFDSSAENIVERIENAEHSQSAEDYDFILAEATKIGNFKQPK